MKNAIRSSTGRQRPPIGPSGFTARKRPALMHSPQKPKGTPMPVRIARATCDLWSSAQHAASYGLSHDDLLP